jgi:hypothetical protein
MLLAMSVMPVNNLNYVWSKNPFFSLAISNLISRDRFKTIDKFFHLEDNQQNIHNPSKIYKIEFFLRHINSISQSIWVPKIGLCIDEAVEPFKGRSKLIMYHPQKPHKWGIRLYVLTCISSAFTLNIEIC